MKNLALIELVHKPTPEILGEAQVFALTPNLTYFISNNSLYEHNFSQNRIVELCPQLFEDAVHIKVLTIEKKICVATKNAIHIFNPEGNCELQTLCFDNISAISWNPTEELVAIVTDNGAVATYSIDYENCEVFPQGQSNVWAEIPDTVYVGWGSKETQFRGSEGKLKNQVPVEAQPVEDKKPTISWRGNSEMFVVNYWEAQRRKFVIFETPCTLLYRSEECPGLQPPVAWRPVGNMIATIADTNTQNVVVFEKNGQKRFNFELNFGSVKIKQLKWSPCAQILALWSDNQEIRVQTIHLLTSSNYKWYVKQTLSFRGHHELLDFDWLESTQFTYVLKVVTKSDVLTYTFCNIVSQALSVCAVIDGKTLQLTDFKDSVIPPIMCFKKIINTSPINFVAFNNNLIAIVDSENQLKTFDFNEPDIIISCVDLGDSLDDVSNFPLACHHFLYKDFEIYFITETSSDSIIYKMNPQNIDVDFIDAATNPVRHLLTIDTNCDISHLRRVLSNFYVNDSCYSIILEDVTIVDNNIYDCHLNLNCHFYVNNHLINDCVNSFIIFDRYLLYTTKLNQLHCLRLNPETINSDSYSRSIEQGAIIVTAIQSTPKVVLQLPRGNLETISCRLISIDILDRLLNDQKWDEALRFIRLEKLNSNLLFDLNPNRFLEQIGKFINATKTVNELNNICLEFDEGNVLTTVYRNWGKSQIYSEKIETIFRGLFKYFDKVDYAPYITTIVIINLNFFTLRDGLVYLQDLLRRSHNDAILKQKLIVAINTLKNYGCDEEKLYSQALLLYDLDLARFVASCCQLDPRIYEPHLNNLTNLSEVERRYQINQFGKKPKSAIKYLLRCPNVTADIVLTFIKNFNVSREAYDSCPKNSQHYEIVSRAFALDLSKRGCHYEAGVILKRGGLLREALEEFKLSLRWRQVLDLLQELELGDVERLNYINDLAKKLSQSHMIKEAAILYDFYAGNYEMAVKILLENYCFEEVIHIAKRYKRNDIIVSEVVPLLMNHQRYLGEKLTDLNDSFERYRQRLALVRLIRVNKINNFDEGEDRDDLFSDVGSTITKSSRSSRSRSSTASSRSRRKEEKKKQDLREGGIYEDIALIRALHCTIKEIYNKGDEVRSCCLLLLQECDVSYKEVKDFHDLYRRVIGSVKKNLGEIWPPHFHSNSQTQSIQEMADLENYEHLDMEYRTPPVAQDNWKLNLF